MVQEQQIAAAVGSGRNIGGGTQAHRLTVKHGNLVRFQPQDQRPTTAHRSALIHADAAGLFGREIQQRITPPLASKVSFSIRTIAVTLIHRCRVLAQYSSRGRLRQPRYRTADTEITRDAKIQMTLAAPGRLPYPGMWINAKPVQPRGNRSAARWIDNPSENAAPVSGIAYRLLLFVARRIAASAN